MCRKSHSSHQGSGVRTPRPPKSHSHVLATRLGSSTPAARDRLPPPGSPSTHCMHYYRPGSAWEGLGVSPPTMWSKVQPGKRPTNQSKSHRAPPTMNTHLLTPVEGRGWLGGGHRSRLSRLGGGGGAWQG